MNRNRITKKSLKKYEQMRLKDHRSIFCFRLDKPSLEKNVVYRDDLHMNKNRRKNYKPSQNYNNVVSAFLAIMNSVVLAFCTVEEISSDRS